jgi:hypothetical protein
MARKPPHLDAAALQALYDDELSLADRMRARKHLRHCARCAERSVAHRATAARVAALLNAGGYQQPDVTDAWQRFLIRGGPGHHPNGTIGGVLIAAMIAAIIVFAQGARGNDLVSTMYRMSAQTHSTPKGPTHGDLDFARSLATLEAKGQLHRVSDVCCADRDGEGPPDDGVLTVTLAGRRSPVVILYEDTQRVGRFQPGDVVLHVSTRG